jgi:hypothetical protein
VVAYACNPSTQEAKIGGLSLRPRLSYIETLSQKQIWVLVAHACNLATQEAEIRRIVV